MTQHTQEPGYWHSYWRTLLSDAALLLLLAGAAYLLWDRPSDGANPVIPVLEQPSELTPDDPSFPALKSLYPIDQVMRFTMTTTTNPVPEFVHVAHYEDAAGTQHSAMIYPAPEAEDERLAPAAELQRMRHESWSTLSHFVNQSVSPNTLLLTWWDNAQRIHLHTGRRTWNSAPAPDAFSDSELEDVWQQLGGKFAPESTASRMLAQWLGMEADAAVEAIANQLQKPEFHLLVSIDDLSHLSELAELTGERPPFEARVFKAGGPVRALKGKISDWAKSNGDDNYLLQTLPGGDVKAWRITTAAGKKTLLARLLPFTSSLAKTPPDSLKLIFRSKRSNYLSIYQWRAPTTAAGQSQG